METVVINAKTKSEAALLLSLAKKMGLTGKTLTRTQVEDWEFAQKIEKGMKSESVGRSDIMKALGK